MYPLGLVTGMMLGRLLEEVDPIDFKCVVCKHSYKKHGKNICVAGTFNPCKCTQFVLNRQQIEDAEKEILALRTKLLQNMPEVEKLIEDV
jgi:ribosomal protein S16